MLTQNSYTFGGSSLHGDIIAQGDFEPQIVAETFFGIAGEAHLLGATGGRDLFCNYDLSGFSTAIDLGAQLAEYSAKINILTGDLVISGNINGTYPKCTFLGYQKISPIFYDGSGVNGWCCFVRLAWRQRAQS